MLLYLLRHSKAEEKGRKVDKDRILTAKGKADALAKAKKWRERLAKVDLIVTSPYPRAAQTAEIFATTLGKPKILKQEPMLSASSSAFDILTMLQENKWPEHVLLVGHEPWMTELAGLLFAGSENCRIHLKKPGLIALNVKDFAPFGATLESLR